MWPMNMIMYAVWNEEMKGVASHVSKISALIMLHIILQSSYNSSNRVQKL
jgi:hypothetical protein